MNPSVSNGMNKSRLDQALVARKMVATRSQAESYIKLGDVMVNGKVITKAGFPVRETDKISLSQKEQYVSRAGLKLASVADKFSLAFADKIVLDVGSSTGGFSDFALKHGAAKVMAVDVGTDQMHPSLKTNPKLELHEKTDIRDFKPSSVPDIVVADVSFISLREILPSVAAQSGSKTQIVAMVKPQFEAGEKDINKGVIKNDKIRRKILRDFEEWTKQMFVTADKADSQVAGGKGNLERFYLLYKRG